MEYNQFKTTSAEYYEDYYRELLENYLPGPVIALFLFHNVRASLNISFNGYNNGFKMEYNPIGKTHQFKTTLNIMGIIIENCGSTLEILNKKSAGL